MLFLRFILAGLIVTGMKNWDSVIKNMYYIMQRINSMNILLN